MVPIGYRGPTEFVYPEFPVAQEAYPLEEESEEIVYADAFVVSCPLEETKECTALPSAPPLSALHQPEFTFSAPEETKEEISSPSAPIEEIAPLGASEEVVIATSDGVELVILQEQLDVLAENSSFFHKLRFNKTWNAENLRLRPLPTSFRFETDSFNLGIILNTLEKRPSDLPPEEIVKFLLSPLLPALKPSECWCKEADEILGRIVNSRRYNAFLARLSGIDVSDEERMEQILLENPQIFKQDLALIAELPKRFENFFLLFPLYSKRLMIRHGQAYMNAWNQLRSQDPRERDRAFVAFEMRERLKPPICFSSSSIREILADTETELPQGAKWHFIENLNIRSYTQSFSSFAREEFSELTHIQGIRELHFDGYLTQNFDSISSYAPMYDNLEVLSVKLETDFSNPLRRMRTMTIDEAMRLLELDPNRKKTFRVFSLTVKNANFLSSAANVRKFFSCFETGKLKELTLINENSDFSPDILNNIDVLGVQTLNIKYQGITGSDGKKIPNRKPLPNLSAAIVRWAENISIHYTDAPVSLSQLAPLETRFIESHSLSLTLTIDEQIQREGQAPTVSLKMIPRVDRVKRLFLSLQAKPLYQGQENPYKFVQPTGWKHLQQVEELALYMREELPDPRFIRVIPKLRGAVFLYPKGMDGEVAGRFDEKIQQTRRRYLQSLPEGVERWGRIVANQLEDYLTIYES